MKAVCSTTSSEPHVYHLLRVMCESFVMQSAFISHNNWFVSVIHSTHKHTNTHTNANEVTGTSASLFSCCRGRKAAEQHIHPLIGEEVLIRWAAQRRRGRLHVSRRFSVSTGQRGWFEDTEGFVYFSLTDRKWTRWQIHKQQVHKSSWSSSLYLCQFEIWHLKYKVMQGRLHAVKSSHAQ